jgi:hypothetical protein
MADISKRHAQGAEADAKGVCKFVRRLEARNEGGDRANKNEQTRRRTLTGSVAHDRRHYRVEGKGAEGKEMATR